MFNVFNEFTKNESGAVTVDWVVLTAAIIGLGAATMTSVGSGATDLASLTSDTVSSSAVGQRFFSASMTANTYFVQATSDNGNMKTLPTYKLAKNRISEDAPEGYYFGLPADDDRAIAKLPFIDSATGKPIYYSADGKTYSIGGNTISEEDYLANGGTKTGVLKTWLQYKKG
jgi:hypothetical protein